MKPEDLAARFAALEYVLLKVGAAAFLNAGLRPEQIAEMRKNADEKLGLESFEGLPWQTSAYLAGEIADQVDSLLAGLSSEMEALIRQARHGA